MSMHKPALVKVHWYLRKLSPGNENTDGRTTDGRTDGHKDSQSENIISRKYRVADIVAEYKKK